MKSTVKILLYVGGKGCASINSLCQEYITRCRGWKIDIIYYKTRKELRKKLLPSDLIILFDEGGKSINSLEFSSIIAQNPTNIVFCIGDAFGFDDDIYSIQKNKISFGSMVIGHSIVKLLACEQLYRAYSILNSHPYHKD